MAASTSSTPLLLQCDAYNNSGDGLKITTTTNTAIVNIQNCNFLKNTGWGVNTARTTGLLWGRIVNCGFGSGTKANGMGTTNNTNNIDVRGGIMYPGGTTPWVDPDNGDFSINLPAAQGTGRGTFTETASSYSGTVGYPDVGAAQASIIASPLWAGATFTCPVAFINHVYSLKQNFLVPLAFNLQSGTLPPGLTLTQLDSQTFLISGTPTTLGTYDFVIRGTQGAAFGDILCEIVVNADPDEGAGGVGGG